MNHTRAYIYMAALLFSGIFTGVAIAEGAVFQVILGSLIAVTSIAGLLIHLWGITLAHNVAELLDEAEKLHKQSREQVTKATKIRKEAEALLGMD